MWAQTRNRTIQQYERHPDYFAKLCCKGPSTLQRGEGLVSGVFCFDDQRSEKLLIYGAYLLANSRARLQKTCRPTKLCCNGAFQFRGRTASCSILDFTELTTTVQSYVTTRTLKSFQSEMLQNSVICNKICAFFIL